MSLRRLLLISLIISSMLFFFPHMAHSQTFNIVEDEDGQIDNMVELDGQIYMLLEVEKAREILAKLKESELKDKEIALIVERKNLLESIIKEQSLVISLIEADRLANKEIMDRLLLKEEKWYENSLIVFGASFVFSSMMYGYWSYMSK
jgi:tRNA1(Val) A37 N6-methylase TrmN6